MKSNNHSNARLHHELDNRRPKTNHSRLHCLHNKHLRNLHGLQFKYRRLKIQGSRTPTSKVKRMLWSVPELGQESTCSICFEPWTNSGGHRLVSIKCGHLFGESCISKWIASQTGQNGKPKCPECNRPAKRNDIRRLWSKAVVTLDTSEKDEAVAKLRKEQEARIRSETDLANSRMAYEMLKIQMTNLQKKHDRQRSLKLK
ncbi:RING finger and WD repeat domain-containing protein 3 [Podila clonocystis]|nr:RING finger and WD repeat domain-containing protein 3 [Podila clonocystis]